VDAVSTDFRHDVPQDLGALLESAPMLESAWSRLTELARNEWICWVTSVKKQQTRSQRLARLQEDILGGKKRPCCWPGCPHRRASAQKWFRD
jgi:uncharacterized protein YdeI (YjbR/CyaY-like superfamily)